jgi:thioester reductase-like protein
MIPLARRPGASPRAVLITGATGFVGMELLARYLERSERRVIAPVRAADDRAAANRVDGVLRGLFGTEAARYGERVEAVAADLTAPNLGLPPRRLEEIAERVDHIIHSAASVSFSLPLDQARVINVEGTRTMLQLAELARERGGLERYCHVSTAYVSGTHAGSFGEHELDVGQQFRNTYEQSKFEAEQLVRAQRGLPTTILRPSIVVGDRRSGWTAAFNVLYWPLRAFARGLYPAVPAIPSAPVDVVSIDYVADAIYELSRSPGGIGETYHLTAGAHASNIAELSELASRYFDRPPPRVLAPAEFASLAERATGMRRSALEESQVLFPYFAIRTVFDDTRARARLEPAGIRVSPLADYLERLLDFATRTRWGKRPLSRAAALAR